MPRPHRILRCERMDYRSGFTGADQKKYPTFHLSISWNSICNTKLNRTQALVQTSFRYYLIPDSYRKCWRAVLSQFSGPYQIKTMSVSFDPNDELFRSYLVNDLKLVSIITTQASVKKKGSIAENTKCSHCDVILPDPLERAQHEKTHFTFECKYCYSLFVRQSELTRHLETSHNIKSLLL